MLAEGSVHNSSTWAHLSSGITPLQSLLRNLQRMHYAVIPLAPSLHLGADNVPGMPSYKLHPILPAEDSALP